MFERAIFRSFCRGLRRILFASVFCVFFCGAAHCETVAFSVTTTNVSAWSTVQFNLSAQGIFAVDCGGGVLQGPGISGATATIIDRSSSTTTETYGCKYTSAGEKTISFYTGYVATGYSSGSNTAAISFKNSSYVARLNGDLSAVFPELGTTNNQKPNFYEAFYGCTNLTTISSTLFSGIVTGRQNMFYNTFHGCTNLEEIPSGLFSNITTGANNMFSGTFSDCTKLEEIPSGLFSNITNVTNANSMFANTFNGCTKLTTIPANLFSGITEGASNLFMNTFKSCHSLKVIPSGLFSNITTSANRLFDSTFDDCRELTTIPANLFSGITTGSNNMFYGTFSRCSSLEQIPSGLFANITTGANSMFYQTFYGCNHLTTIPSNLFSSITSGATSMFAGTFSGCGQLQGIPEDFRFGGVNISGYDNMFDNTFFYCYNIKKLPLRLFDNITSSADNMFKETFSHCINLVGYIPPTLFEKLTPRNNAYPANMMSGVFASTALDEQCLSGTTNYTTGYEGSTYGWGNKVSCKTTSYTVEYSCGIGSGTAPGNMLVDEDVSFTPEANTCTSPSADKIFVGWGVSGTNDIKQPGTAFIWEYDEDKTFTAQWGCDNANNYWWNADNTACVQGYTITLSVNSQLPEPDSDPDPTTLYTIPTRGAYLDAQRTLLMTESEHPITPPQRFFTTEYDTNAPDNPITNEPYNISEVEDQDYHYNYKCFLKVDNECRITANTGYITNQGIADAQNIYENQHWFVSAGGISTSYPRSKPILTGYNCDGWYTSADDSGSLVTYFSSYIHPSLLYAHWTPISYNIVYELGDGQWGTNANHQNSAYYDTPFNVSMPTRDGYTFGGWIITGMDSMTHYYGDNNQVNSYSSFDNTTLNNVTKTWFMNLRSTSGTITFTAIWQQNAVNLKWIINGQQYNTNPSSCTYETGQITGITHEEIPGWTFLGWKVTDWQ